MQPTSVEFVKGVVDWEGLPKDGMPEVAFMGRSNVGKSSLLNFLLGRRRPVARTSSTPGKTREINYFRINERFFLVDLPGLGYAKVSRYQRERWAHLIERYVGEHPAVACVLHLIDSRHPPTPIDQGVMEFMRAVPVPYIVVLTKSDKIPRGQQSATMKRTVAALHDAGLDVPVVMTSATKGEGQRELWQLVREAGVAIS